MHVVAARNLIRILALVQKKTLIKPKNHSLKCLIRHYLTVWSIKNVAVLTEDGAFAPVFRPHPGGFDSSRVPTPGNLPSIAKKMLMPICLGLGAGGIDWCISNGNRTEWSPLRSVIIRVTHNLFNQEYDYRPNWTTRSSVTN